MSSASLKRLRGFDLQHSLLVRTIQELTVIVNEAFIVLGEKLPKAKQKLLYQAQIEASRILKEAKKYAGSADTYIRILAEDKTVTPAFASVVVARIVLYLISTRIGIHRVLHYMLSIIIFTLLPGVYQQLSHTSEDKSLVALGTSSQSIQSKLLIALQEVPQLSQDVFFLIRAYWRLGKRIVSLGNMLLPIFLKSGKSWAEIPLLVKKLMDVHQSLKK